MNALWQHLKQNSIPIPKLLIPFTGQRKTFLREQNPGWVDYLTADHVRKAISNSKRMITPVPNRDGSLCQTASYKDYRTRTAYVILLHPHQNETFTIFDRFADAPNHRFGLVCKPSTACHLLGLLATCCSDAEGFETSYYYRNPKRTCRHTHSYFIIDDDIAARLANLLVQP